MTTNTDKPPTRESKGSASARPQVRCTWLPILGGVLCGMIALCLLAKHEPVVFCRLTAWMFNETPPVKIIEPHSIHFTLFMLTLAGVGGSIGVLFSEWCRIKSFLSLLATLLVIAAFAALGAAFDAQGGLWDALGFH